MKGKVYNTINVVFDLLIVVAVQIAIVFVILLLPGALTIIREVGARGYSSFGAIPIGIMRSIIDENWAFQMLIRFVRCAGIFLAPFFFEYFRKKKDISRRCIRSLRPEWREILKGLLRGTAFIAMSIALTALISFSFPDFRIEEIGMQREHSLLIVLNLLFWCVSTEIFSRLYLFIRASNVPYALFVVLSCCLHIYSAIGFFSVMDFYRVIYLVLISLFLALRMLTESPTQGNIGFNIMATFFLAFGVEPCLKKTSMGVFTVLVLMCAYELFILRKKLEIT